MKRVLISITCVSLLVTGCATRPASPVKGLTKQDALLFMPALTSDSETIPQEQLDTLLEQESLELQIDIKRLSKEHHPRRVFDSPEQEQRVLANEANMKARRERVIDIMKLRAEKLFWETYREYWKEQSNKHMEVTR